MATFDFHMHTDSSPDGNASALEMCEAAIAKGITHIAITDHLDFPDYETDHYAERTERSWAEQAAAKAAVEGRLRVERGIEIGSPLLDVALTEKTLAAHPYDYVLASLHQLGRHPDFYFLDFTQIDILKTIDDYFEGIYDIVKWGKFSSLAHLTYPFRYIPDDLRPKDYSRWDDHITTILKALAQSGRAMEINTSGLRKKIGVTSPDFPLIKRYFDCGGELVTVGSDAHYTQDVGANIDDGIALAQKAGFRYITVFESGEPKPLSIEELLK